MVEPKPVLRYNHETVRVFTGGLRLHLDLEGAKRLRNMLIKYIDWKDEDD